MLEQIKQDLRDIRSYYQAQQSIDISAKNVNYDFLLDKIKLYNEAISKAKPSFYQLYNLFYVEGLSLEEAAEEMEYSYYYVLRKSRQLKEYFNDYFKKHGYLENEKVA